MTICKNCGFDRNKFDKCLKCGYELYQNASFEEYLIDDLHSINFNQTNVRIFPTFMGGDKFF